jgi:hypothetical protein
MRVGIWLRRLLPILAVLGLIAGPFAVSASGAVVQAASALSMSDMAEDMSCCPVEKPNLPDCPKSCPLMALCMAKCSSVSSTPSSLVVFWDQTDTLLPANAVFGDALVIEPPARPPRI